MKTSQVAKTGWNIQEAGLSHDLSTMKYFYLWPLGKILAHTVLLNSELCYQSTRLPNSFFCYYDGIGGKEKIEDSFTVKIKCSWLLPRQLFLECLIIKTEAVIEKSIISFSSFQQEALRKLSSATEGKKILLLRTVKIPILFESSNFNIGNKYFWLFWSSFHSILRKCLPSSSSWEPIVCLALL